LPAVLNLDWQIIETSFGPLPVRAHVEKQLDQMDEYEREVFLKRNAGRVNQFLQDSRYQQALDRCRKNAPKALVEQGIEQDSEPTLGLDRALLLHALLTGQILSTTEPLDRAIEGGTKIGEDFDCGRARFLTPKEVLEIADALSKVSDDELKGKLDSGTIDYEL